MEQTALAGSGQILFSDCASRKPAGRRSLCFDDEALKRAKENKPQGSAAGMARAMGVELLSEAQYRAPAGTRRVRPQDLELDRHAWRVARALGGALFLRPALRPRLRLSQQGQSYYAARGFRGLLRV